MNKEESYAKIASLLVEFCFIHLHWNSLLIAWLLFTIHFLTNREKTTFSHFVGIILTNKLYNLYNDSSKDSDWNFIMFKLYSNGQYEVKVFS